MDITIAICSHNRKQSLGRALISLAQSQVPKNLDWEVLVINNNSTDGTEQILPQFKNSLPLVSVFESAVGASRARNRALSEARSNLILMTDDDCTVAPNWISEMVIAANQWPEAAFFGGVIVPSFEDTPPPWIANHLIELTGPFAILNYDQKIRPLNFGELPYGANMMLRKSELGRLRFNPNLGPNQGIPGCSEEIELFLKIQEEGGSGIWVGSACIEHHIAKSRMKPYYILRRQYWGARSNFSSATLRKFNPPASILRASFRFLLSTSLILFLGKNHPSWTAHLNKVGYAAGTLMARLRELCGKGLKAEDSSRAL